jgi:hypothetical protein
MAVLTLLTTEDPFQKQNVNLDGVDFIVSLSFNQREERWYLSIADDEGTPLISGLKLLANYRLLFRHRYNTKLPAGEIMAIDTTPDGSPPTLLELGAGKRCVLTYLDAAEVAAQSATPQGATPVPIYIAVRVTALGGYPGDAAYAGALAAACARLSSSGFRISTNDVLAAASGIAGATVTGLEIGLSAPLVGPVSIVTRTLSVGANQRPTFSAGWISVVSV